MIYQALNSTHHHATYSIHACHHFPTQFLHTGGRRIPAILGLVDRQGRQWVGGRACDWGTGGGFLQSSYHPSSTYSPLGGEKKKVGPERKSRQNTWEEYQRGGDKINSCLVVSMHAMPIVILYCASPCHHATHLRREKRRNLISPFSRQCLPACLPCLQWYRNNLEFSWRIHFCHYCCMYFFTQDLFPTCLCLPLEDRRPLFLFTHNSERKEQTAWRFSFTVRGRKNSSFHSIQEGDICSAPGLSTRRRQDKFHFLLLHSGRDRWETVSASLPVSDLVLLPPPLGRK